LSVPVEAGCFDADEPAQAQLLLSR
jgi:hypothetical protein